MDADDAIFGNNEYPVFYFYDVVNGFSVKSYGKLTQGDVNAESSGNADTTSAGSDTSTDTSGADSQAEVILADLMAADLTAADLTAADLTFRLYYVRPDWQLNH